MKKILVPVNFSAVSLNAAEYAAPIAKAFGAEIQLLHVYKDLVPPTIGPEPWTVTVSKTQVQSESQMNKEIEFLTRKYLIKVNGEIRNGPKLDSINKAVEETKAGLMVMGLRSDRKKALHSATIKMIGKTDIPVLIVPEGTSFVPFKNIVLAVDFNEITDGSGFEPLFKVIKTFDASLRVIHVEKKGAETDASQMPGKLELGRILGKLSYLYDYIENDDVEQGILDFVQNHPTDLLVMVAHQFSGTVYTRSIGLKTSLPLLVLKTTGQ
jgi:nucleotide-binding universal stress UspA family protein